MTMLNRATEADLEALAVYGKGWFVAEEVNRKY